MFCMKYNTKYSHIDTYKSEKNETLYYLNTIQLYANISQIILYRIDL